MLTDLRRASAARRRAACVIAVALACAMPRAAQAEPGEPLHASSEGELREALLRLAERRLGSDGLHVDAARARLTLSRPLRFGEPLEAVPLWRAGPRPDPLPLQFELRPSDATVVRATLATPLHLDVCSAVRRIERGAPLSGDDIQPRRRPLATVPADALDVPCRVAPGAVALRALEAGDVVRRGDAGERPAVLADAELQLVVSSGSVALRTRAIALSDARLGDTVRVRVPGRPGPFRARVTAPGVAALAEEQR